MESGYGIWLKALAGAALVAGVGFVLTGSGRGASEGPARAESSAVTVLTAKVAERKLEEVIVTDGSIRAKYYSLVSPRIDGLVDDVFVREGDAVETGKTKLFQIDNEKLGQAVDLNAQALVIANSTLEEKRANLEKAEADLAQAAKDFARIANLYRQGVVTLSDHEQAGTRVTQLTAAKKLCEAQLKLAEQSVGMAAISLRMAERDYADSVMYAPMDGVVSGRFAEPGEMGNTGKSIVRIDDTGRLKAVAYLPGQYYPRIDPGLTRVQVAVLDREIGVFPITYKAPGIDSALRTFEIWADVPGDRSYSVPGAQAAIKTILRETSGAAVPRDAILHRDGAYWVFLVEGGAARMVRVAPGLETDGWTEILDAPLIKAGDRVVVQGHFFLNDGDAVTDTRGGDD